MNMDRKAFASIAVCAAFYLAYSVYLNKKYPDFHNQQPGATTEVAGNSSNTHPAVENGGAPNHRADATNESASSPSNGSEANPVQTVSQATTPEKPLAVLTPEESRTETNVTRLMFDVATGSLKSLELKDYSKGIELGPMNLADPEILFQPGILDESIPRNSYASEKQGRQFKFTRETPDWKISHTYSVPDAGYGLDVETTWLNQSSAAKPLMATLNFTDSPKAPEKKGSWIPGAPTERPHLVVGYSKDQKQHDAEKFCADSDVKSLASEPAADLAIVGFDRHYFASSLLVRNPNGQAETFGYDIQKKPLPNSTHCSYTFRLAKNFGDVEPGGVRSLKSRLWFGPKDTHITDAYSSDLRKMFNFGFFGMLTDPLLKGIELFHKVFGNWGLSIVLMTFMLKMLFYPLTKKAAVAMHAQKKWQPEMTRLREKFKDDPRKQQQELMAFMAQHKINPIKGCLPILPQIPVFFAFYTVLSTAIELRQAPFLGWIKDLTLHDPYYIFPVLWGVSMVLQQKLAPTTGLDKTQARIMMIMPVMFTAMMLTLPAGMLIYMLTNTVVSIAQQMYLNRRLENA